MGSVQLQSLLALPLVLDSAFIPSITACGTPPMGHSILLARGRVEWTGIEPALESIRDLTGVLPASPG